MIKITTLLVCPSWFRFWVIRESCQHGLAWLQAPSASPLSRCSSYAASLPFICRRVASSPWSWVLLHRNVWFFSGPTKPAQARQPVPFALLADRSIPDQIWLWVCLNFIAVWQFDSWDASFRRLVIWATLVFHWWGQSIWFCTIHFSGWVVKWSILADWWFGSFAWFGWDDVRTPPWVV